MMLVFVRLEWFIQVLIKCKLINGSRRHQIIYLSFDSHLLKTVFSGQSPLTWPENPLRLFQLHPNQLLILILMLVFADITTVACGLSLAVITDGPETYQKLFFIGF